MNKKMKNKEYIFPPLSLLPLPEETGGDPRGEMTETADRLVKALAECGVQASVTDMYHGPAVTRYYVTPANRARAYKIKALAQEIALCLSVANVRIEDPVPGRDAVGIEVPNRTPSPVCLRQLVDTDGFRSPGNMFGLALGQDIDGNNIFCDITRMPHLLIGGSAGTGKSACVNAMLASLLYKASPGDARLIMIGTKAAGPGVYEGIPHLLVPVISDAKKAGAALRWAVEEMEKRYSLLKEREVRNIDNYNMIAGSDPALSRMPRILIVIDELAGLMTVSPGEVETAVARLAAKARAVGIHLIVATQRPEKDVITDVIKNNIPSRIAFAVTSSKDSRAILDEDGAERLIGRGDMLYKPIGKKPLRVQGCYITDEEFGNVVGFIRENNETAYDAETVKKIENAAAGADAPEESGEDELFISAAETVVEAGQASTSLLQRRLGIGYARAGRLIDRLCDMGCIGPFRGTMPREVLLTRGQLAEIKQNAAPQNIPGKKKAVCWKEYRETVINTPFAEGLEYAPTALWLHPEDIPVGVVKSDRAGGRVIRVPGTAVNKYGRTVPVEAVGRNAFPDSPATDIILLPSVNSISPGAFAGCRSLERIVIPKAVRKIGQGTFENCTALTDIYYEGSPEEWEKIEIAHRKHEDEFGEPVAGSPVREKTAERYINIPGNEPVFSANIHFFCVI